MHAAALWLLLSLAGAGQMDPPMAGVVYRCGQADAVRYQDVPCAAGEASHRWRPPAGRVDPADVAGPAIVEQAPAAAARGKAASRRRRIAGRKPAMALITIQQDPAACRRMQRQRENALRQRRRAPGYLLERAWDDRVRDACR